MENESERESEQESGQESSENEIKKSSKNTGQKLPFGNYFKGDKHFYPGNPFNYSFPEANEDLKKKLEVKLNKKKKTIKQQLNNLAGQSYIKLNSGRRKLPCPFKTCQFEGTKLKRHLTGKSHHLNERDAMLKESYLTHKVKYICSIIKHGLHKPSICPDCNIFIKRIDNHFSHVHQVRKGTAEMTKKVKYAKKFTRQYEINLSNIDEDFDEDQSDEEQSDENENEQERKNIKHKEKQKPAKKDKNRKQISEHLSDNQSTISSPKPRSKKMPRSTAKHTRLRGVYVPVSPSKYKNISLLKYRKSLTSDLKKKKRKLIHFNSSIIIPQEMNLF